ncbi:hypothetical protein [Flavihumibacter sp.]|uniref:hypothetical protein n=1 Tax=Flavihumibacter sp. TaxID=1913981 RepID=UPI002FC70A78
MKKLIFQDSIPLYLKWILAGYLSIAIIFFFPLRYMMNLDAVSYLSIAKSYGMGHIYDAVNAYWSPMLSWVIAPFTHSEFELLFVFKIYNILVGFAGMIACWILLNFLGVHENTKAVFLSVIATIILRFVYDVTSPDLSSAVLLLFFAYYWLKGYTLQKPLITAIWLGVLYLVKSYNFYFISGVILWSLLESVFSEPDNYRNAIKKYLLVYVCFFLLVSPWLYALYSKYGYLMLTGSGGFNHGGMMYDNWKFLLEFVAPVNNNEAVTAWQDPILASGFRDYNAFGSWNNFLFQVNVIWHNLLSIIITRSSTRLLCIAGAVSLVLACYRAYKNPSLDFLRSSFLKLLFFFLLNIAGYLFLFIEDRYLWVNVLISFIVFAHLGDQMITQWLENSNQSFINWKLVFTVVAISIVFLRYLNQANFFVPQPYYKFYSMKEYKLGKELSAGRYKNSRMAKWPDSSDYQFFGSVYVAYFAEGKHYLSLPAQVEVANQLITQNQITIVFVPASVAVPESHVISSWNRLREPIMDCDVYLKPL